MRPPHIPPSCVRLQTSPRPCSLRLLTVPFLLILALSACSYLRPKPTKEALLERGKKYLAQKDYGRAILQLKNAVRADPKNPEVHYQLGLALMGAGDGNPAVQEFMRAAELDPHHTASQLKLAELMASNRDPQVVRDAEKRVAAVLEAFPDNPDALNARAVALARLNRIPEAIQELERSLARSPGHLNSAMTLATLKASSGDAAGAEKLLLDTAKATPNSVEAQLALVKFYWMRGQAEPAERHARRALELQSDNGPALSSLAAIQSKQGRKDEAARTYRRLATLPGKQYRGVYVSYLMEQGQAGAAIAELERLYKSDPKDRDLRTQLVWAYFGAGRQADGERMLTEALRANPKDSEALVQRAEIYIRNHRLTDAQNDLSQALRFQPDSAQTHWVLSRVYKVQGKSPNQRQELTDAVRLDPRFLAARIDLSRNLIASKAANTALEVMEQAPPDQKKTAQYIVERNAALLAMGDMARLRQGIDEGLALEKSPDLLLQDGLYRIKRRDFAGARKSLDQALHYAPDDLRISESRALTYVAEQKMPAAIAWVREWAGSRPKSAGAQFLLGKWLFKGGDAAGARAAFEAAIAADPRFEDAASALTDLDLREGKLEPARNRLQAQLARNPADLQSRLRLALVEDKAGNHLKAIAAYRQVLSSEPNHIVALNNLAYLLANTRMPDEALKYAQQARELSPNSPAIEETLGWAFFQKGLYPSAVQYLQSAVKKQPTSRGQYHLALAFLKSGDTRRSEESLKAALRLDPSFTEARTLLEQSAK